MKFKYKSLLLPLNDLYSIHKSINLIIDDSKICLIPFRDCIRKKALLTMITPKMDSVDKAELTVLRKQLKAFPDALREQARNFFVMNEDKKQRDLQDFQMVMIGKLEKILRKRN